VLRNGLNLMAVPSSAQVAGYRRAGDRRAAGRRTAEQSMTATDAGPLRRGLSGEATQFAARIAAALAVCIVLSLLSDAFLTTSNLLNVLRQTALLFLMASGLTLGDPDGRARPLGRREYRPVGVPLPPSPSSRPARPGSASRSASDAASLIGLLNGLLVTALRVPAFIATYGMMWLILGATYSYMGGETVHGFPPAFRQFGSGYFLGIPIPIYMMILFLLLGTLFAQRTVWGQQIYAIGANPVAARLSGIPVERRLVLVYVVSGADGGARLAHPARARELGRSRYRRAFHPAGDRRGGDRRDVAVRAARAPSSGRSPAR
jgi:ribose transport system permease protein